MHWRYLRILGLAILVGLVQTISHPTHDPSIGYQLLFFLLLTMLVFCIGSASRDARDLATNSALVAAAWVFASIVVTTATLPNPL